MGTQSKPPKAMRPQHRKLAEAARGFMPSDEGLALYEAAMQAPEGVSFLEVGSYCGKSSLYLGSAAQQRGVLLFAVDHHRGSEENQPGWQWHEPDLVDPKAGRLDTLPHFRRTIYEAGLEPYVVAVVGDSPTLAAVWGTPLALLFIDGGHGSAPAHADFDSWTPHLIRNGVLAIHDVFANPEDGGRPPYEIYCRAVESGKFKETAAVGSLRVLRKSDL